MTMTNVQKLASGILVTSAVIAVYYWLAFHICDWGERHQQPAVVAFWAFMWPVPPILLSVLWRAFQRARLLDRIENFIESVRPSHGHIACH